MKNLFKVTTITQSNLMYLDVYFMLPSDSLQEAYKLDCTNNFTWHFAL